ncbi:Uncharacterized protein PPKH_1499 [Pseudomonas putida]|nr:Uncharacterized protein PPKH_1499 [Pseudomonas putida]
MRGGREWSTCSYITDSDKLALRLVAASILRPSIKLHQALDRAHVALIGLVQRKRGAGRGI